MPTPNGPKAGLGRDIRFVMGACSLIANGYLIWTKAHEVPRIPLTTQDLILHLMFFAAAILLMDPARFVEVLGMVKDKLPFGGPKA